ncbi:copper resistance B precursor [Thermocrinis albus DSM 14484]|uniref:Copper resistance B n=1 Tax=Thermocrinis albus (strain DSM 14484 / JCM 11386 / HI 11/12) TaxID=638303 RepID=D3SM50_THEAH|nr:copper resistance protein B [Thermocrinis albus]ADC89830.1 copper resistance B precursor [Thermocrinis albus DSM 14484]
MRNIFLGVAIGSTVMAQEVSEELRQALMPSHLYGKLLLDRLEYLPSKKTFRYDAEFWYGGDFHRVYIETEGNHSLKRGDGEIKRADIYIGKLVTPFWTMRLGAGAEGEYRHPFRKYVVVGVEGLAPYWFEVDANMKVDTEGRTSLHMKTYVDLLITQKLVLQPRVEGAYYLRDIPKVSRPAGLSRLEAGLRLRYEFRRELAPYIGLQYSMEKGKEGKKEGTHFLLGLRMWF